MKNRYMLFLCFSLLGAGSSLLLADEDSDFLEAMEAELGKVSPNVVKSNSSQSDGVIREDFESGLKENHKGSYRFYKKLPQHYQDEIYRAFLEGMPFVEIRKKILDRYFQQ